MAAIPYKSKCHKARSLFLFVSSCILVHVKLKDADHGSCVLVLSCSGLKTRHCRERNAFTRRAKILAENVILVFVVDTSTACRHLKYLVGDIGTRTLCSIHPNLIFQLLRSYLAFCSRSCIIKDTSAPLSSNFILKPISIPSAH